jgi:flagellar motor switch protein FliM
VELGKARLNFREFYGLKVGDVVNLNRRKDEDITLKIQGRPKFTVAPAMKGQQLCFTITDSIETP